jgi:2-amino-4-hydroxy-6-hydroxymethyldihydropteridine diphosphokinase
MTAAGFSQHAFVSLGSNLPSGKGDSLETLAFAVEALSSLTDFPLVQSSVYVTSPVDSPEGTPDFFNSMVAFIPRPDETPLTLLHKLQSLETVADRKRSGIRNEARTLDLDLIIFMQAFSSTPELMLPHPRASERRFVLAPLQEIAGADFRIPGMEATLAELLGAIADTQQITRLSIRPAGIQA